MFSGSGHAILSDETLPLSNLSREGVASQAAPLSHEGSVAAIIWRTGFRGVGARSQAISERLERPIDYDAFARLALERDVLVAFLSGEQGVEQLTRRLRLLNDADCQRYRDLLEVPAALYTAAADRQLSLLPASDAPRPREKVLRDEIEAACWTAYREGAASVATRLDELAHVHNHDVDDQIRYGLERAVLTALNAGSKGVASALRRRRAAAEEAGPGEGHVARLAVQVLEPMLRVLLLAEGN